MIAAEVALAFNGINERKSWSARPYATDGREMVHFNAASSLISLTLDCTTGLFEVRFNKVHAAWGDYTRAIARSLYVVLLTLKQAGLPFDAPEQVEGIEIVTTVGANTHVRWAGPPQTAAEATMPELRTPLTANPLWGDGTEIREEISGQFANTLAALSDDDRATFLEDDQATAEGDGPPTEPFNEATD